jgi:mono/diheme cytochrome c family protein
MTFMRKVLFAIAISLALPAAAGAHPAQATYDKMCKSCHGADGAGNPARAKMLKIDEAKLNLGREESAKLTRDDLKKVLLDGKEKMPAYGKKLKPDEVDPMVDLVTELAKTLRDKK